MVASRDKLKVLGLRIGANSNPMRDDAKIFVRWETKSLEQKHDNKKEFAWKETSR